jgi:hypothetical protein
MGEEPLILCKAVYFLFINTPKGIVLQQLEDHHHEPGEPYKIALDHDLIEWEDEE